MSESTLNSAGAPPGIRWARVFAMVLLLALLAEGFSQVYMRVWSGKWYQSLALYRWSSYGLVRNNPRLTSPRFAINANGFRNAGTYTREKPANTLRVIMLGGSVLYSGIVPGVARANEAVASSNETMAQFLQQRLEADPALAGIKIEVINAGINFNRILEVTSGYLADYQYWDPDFLIVCGSGNNFPPMWPAPIPAGGESYIEREHVWKLDFERIINRHSLASWLESSSRTAAEHSAGMALMNKAFQKGVDIAIDRATVRDTLARTQKAREFASTEDVQRTLRDYLGFADAIMSVARQHDQQVSFFWEYFLGELGGLKPMSAEEQRLYPLLREITKDPRDLQHHMAMRDSVQTHVSANGAQFIDPLNELSRSNETVYMDYLHYTSTGNRLMADVMYDRLAPAIRKRAEAMRVANPRQR